MEGYLLIQISYDNPIYEGIYLSIRTESLNEI